MEASVLIKILKKLDIDIQYRKEDLVIEDKYNNLDEDLIGLIKSSKTNRLQHLRKDQPSPKVAHLNLKTFEEQEYYPLSHAQKRIWLIEQLGNTHGVYNISKEYNLRDLDVDALRLALNELINRHEVLRTLFVSIFGEPKQVISNTAEFKLIITDLTIVNESKTATTTMEKISFFTRYLRASII